MNDQISSNPQSNPVEGPVPTAKTRNGIPVSKPIEGVAMVGKRGGFNSFATNRRYSTIAKTAPVSGASQYPDLLESSIRSINDSPLLDTLWSRRWALMKPPTAPAKHIAGRVGISNGPPRGNPLSETTSATKNSTRKMTKTILTLHDATLRMSSRQAVTM